MFAEFKILNFLQLFRDFDHWALDRGWRKENFSWWPLDAGSNSLVKRRRCCVAFGFVRRKSVDPLCTLRIWRDLNKLITAWFTCFFVFFFFLVFLDSIYAHFRAFIPCLLEGYATVPKLVFHDYTNIALTFSIIPWDSRKCPSLKWAGFFFLVQITLRCRQRLRKI